MSIMDLDDGLGAGRVRRRRARRPRNAASAALPAAGSVRAARRAGRQLMAGYELELVGLGAAVQPAAAASSTWTVRAQRDQIPVAVYADCQYAEDITIEAFQISGKNVLRGSGAVALKSFHPKNTQRPGYAFPPWNGGTDLVLTVKNNHAATARTISGGVLVLRKKVR